jgi:TetR/AcrR family transcriptional repressor of nem operon
MSAETRRQLLDVGLDAVRAGGYSAVSIQDVVRAAGVPKGSFHYYFASKEAFALALMKHFAGRMAAVADTLRPDGRAPAADRLRRFFRAYVARMAAEGYRTGCLFGVLALEAAAVSDAVRERVAAGFDAFAAALAPVVREAQAEGAIDPDLDADDTAAFLVDAWQGALLRMRVEGGDAPLRRFERIALDRLIGPS